MFTYLCRIFHQLHSRPKTVLLFSGVLTVFAIYQIFRIPLESAYSHILPEEMESVQSLKKIEKKLGTIGDLTVVVKSQDSASAGDAIQYFASHLQNHPDIHFIDYQTEAAFYLENKLLYISLEDLKEVERRLESGFWLTRQKFNPLIVDLLEPEEKDRAFDEDLTFEDLEEKYFAKLQFHLGTPDGKVRILRIFPDFDITDIHKSRRFARDIRLVRDRFLQEKDSTVNILLTGEVMKIIGNEGRLFTQIIKLGTNALYIIGLILLLFFFRIPMGAILSIIPVSMAVIWTVGLTGLIIGYLTLITASLSLILIGIGLAGIILLLHRYSEEKQKRLSAEVAFETIILETGPPITTGLLVTAAVFFSLIFTRFSGIAEFGLMAGLGMICTLITVLVVYPCLLILVEPHGIIPVFGKRLYNNNLFQVRHFKHWKLQSIVIMAVTGLFCMKGIQTNFQFNLEKLDFPNAHYIADSLLKESGEVLGKPAVAITHNPGQGTRLAIHSRQYIASDSTRPTIQSVTTLTDLLPANQSEKLTVLKALRTLISPEVIKKAAPAIKENLEKVYKGLSAEEIKIEDLPEKYRKKFYGRDRESGQFTFIFPAVDLGDGLNLLAFREDVESLQKSFPEPVQISSPSLVMAELLSNLIPDLIKIMWISGITLLILVFLDQKSIKSSLVIIVPVIFSLLWTIGFMKWMNIQFNHFNLIAFPVITAFAIHHGVHLLHRYLEEGKGSLYFVLKRTGIALGISTLVGAAGFVMFIFSSHQGLSTLGWIATVGIVNTFLAGILFLPALVGFLEHKRNLANSTTNQNKSS